MPFIEHVARRTGVAVEPAPRRLHHDQGMIGDDQVGAPRTTHAPLDVAFLIMLARRVDAFSMVVTEIERQTSADEINQPGWKVTAR